jgi:hypothetical protein
MKCDFLSLRFVFSPIPEITTHHRHNKEINGGSRAREKQQQKKDVNLNVRNKK